MHLIIIIISALWLFSEIILSILRRAKTTDSQLDRSSMKIIWAAIAISIALGVSASYQPYGRFGGESQAFRIAGIVLIILGILIRWIAILTLKRQFTVDVAITRDHRLVMEGIYHYVRHPAYAGTLLSFLGLALVFANYLSLLIVFAPVCSAFIYRIHVEEKVLSDRFGKEYADYCASTKRLVPGVY